MPSIFLSEMSALPFLGGGVTLNKLIGDQISKFYGFIKCYHNHSHAMPAYPCRKSICVPFPRNPSFIAKIFGCRISYFINCSSAQRSFYAKK